MGKRLLVTVLSLLALAGCLAGGDRYITSSSTKMYFKLPGSWKVFPKNQVLANPSPIQGIAASSDRFLIEFDGDPQPSAKHDFVTSGYPFGEARVRTLSTQEHDQYSLASLRNEIIPIDNIVQQNSNAVTLLSPPRMLVHQGLRGSKLSYVVQISAGRSFAVEQVAMVDSPTDTVWLLIVGCSTECFQRFAATIHRVADSWTVQGK